MIDRNVTEIDKSSGIVAYAGSSLVVRAGLFVPKDVVLLDMTQFNREEAEYLKEGRRWIVFKNEGKGEIVLAPATTKDTLAGQGLPGLEIVLPGPNATYAGFDEPLATIHPVLLQPFETRKVLGKVGTLSHDDWLAFLAGLDAGLGIGTGRVGSPGSNTGSKFQSRRGTIWRHKTAQSNTVLVVCHEYSFGDSGPLPVIPLELRDPAEAQPADTTLVTEEQGHDYWAYYLEMYLSEAGVPGADVNWTKPGEKDCLTEHSTQELDGALYDCLDLNQNPELKRPDSNKRGFTMRQIAAQKAMEGSGRFNPVPPPASSLPSPSKKRKT